MRFIDRFVFVLIIFADCAVFVFNQAGNCEFPPNWTGKWFSSERPSEAIVINETHIDIRGQCYESEPKSSQYLLYSNANSETCYRCLVIYERHSNVLQFRESECSTSSQFAANCDNFITDYPFVSIFRQSANVKYVPCPFRNGPFRVEYSNDDDRNYCRTSNSRAQICTDSTQMVFKLNACADYNMESRVTELQCLGLWREGHTNYMVGEVRNFGSNSRYERSYNCFTYSEYDKDSNHSYLITQSAGQNCNDVHSVSSGALIMRLHSTNHSRCMFPTWTSAKHHTWTTLDHRYTYKFSSRNPILRIIPLPQTQQQPQPQWLQPAAATAAITNNRDNSFEWFRDDDETATPAFLSAERKQFAKQQHYRTVHRSRSRTDQFGGSSTATGSRNVGGSAAASAAVSSANNETKVVCHSILETNDRKAQIVVYVTTGCQSGYRCMILHRRSSSILEIQSTETMVSNADEACSSTNFNMENSKFTTLINNPKRPVPCPHSGHYKTKRKAAAVAPIAAGTTAACNSRNVLAMTNGCTKPDQLTLHAPCKWSLNVQNGGQHERGAGTRSPTAVNEPPTSLIGTDFHCFGHWSDDENTSSVTGTDTKIHYLIVAPVSRHSNDIQQLCLVYTFEADDDDDDDDNEAVGRGRTRRKRHYEAINGMVSSSSNSGIDMPDVVSAQAAHLQSGLMLGKSSVRILAYTDSCHRVIANSPATSAMPSSAFWNMTFHFDGSCSQTGSGVTISNNMWQQLLNQSVLIVICWLLADRILT